VRAPSVDFSSENRFVRKALLVVLVFGAAFWLAPGALAAGWCGTDVTAADRPDVVTGQQVHAVVAVPSDAPDTFAADASRIADDVASVDAWWRGQDPTRAPRWDKASFSTGTCLDISYVRLPRPASAYAGAGSTLAFNEVANELVAVGLGSDYKDYLVYFDGPAIDDGVCGTGGGFGFNRGQAFAVVWLLGCPDVPADSISAHELVHAFGALPDGAPHLCPPGQGRHPCDSDQDILWPYSSGGALSTLILDVNHDDYYAHSGSWDDIQDSLWLEHLNTPKIQLNVTFSGAGTIKSEVPGVDCAASCTTQWDQGSLVSLTASPGSNDRFVRWAGSCIGDGDCSLKLDQAVTATAVFGPLRIPVRATTAGRGTIKCTPKCTKSFAAGELLTLHAEPVKGWRFSGWSGACKGTRLTCSPATDFALSVRATFRRR
jgi:hypothetical protein